MHNAYTYIYIYRYIHAYMCISYIHVYIFTHTHTYIHTYIPHTQQLHNMCMHIHNKSKTIAGVAPRAPFSRTGSLLGFYNAGLYQGPNLEDKIVSGRRHILLSISDLIGTWLYFMITKLPGV